MLPFNTNLAKKSARYLAFLVALDAPANPKTPEDARSAELARIVAFEPDRLSAITALSSELLTERDFYAGCQPGVVYDVDSLASHYQTDCTAMLSACKLCGAMPFLRKGRTLWADDERFRYTLDSGAIEWGKANLAGRAA